MRRNWYKVVLPIMGLLLPLACICTELSPTGPPPATSHAPLAKGTSQPSPKEPVPTLPGPLAAVDFPSQVTAYPTDWPPDLRFPDQLSLVETTSGVLPQGVSKGWGAKLVYHGDPRSAADLLSAFFISKGWQTVERTELDSGGFLVLFQRGDKQHTGAVVIDPDTNRPGYTKIVTVIFP